MGRNLHWSIILASEDSALALALRGGHRGPQEAGETEAGCPHGRALSELKARLTEIGQARSANMSLKGGSSPRKRRASDRKARDLF
jgi:hypothetical protein